MNTTVKFEFTSACTVIMWLENTDENKIFFVRSSHQKHFGKAQHVVRWALWWHQKEMLERIIFFIKLSRNFLNMFMYNFLKKKTVNSPINVLPLISATSKNQKKFINIFLFYSKGHLLGENIYKKHYDILTIGRA